MTRFGKSRIRLVEAYRITIAMIAAAILLFSFINPQPVSAAPGTINVVGMKFTGSYECSLSDYGTPINDPIWLADNWGHRTKDEPAAFQRQGSFKIWIDISSPDIYIPFLSSIWVKITMSGRWSRGGEAFPSQTLYCLVSYWWVKEWNNIYFTSYPISSSRPIGRDLLVLDWEFEYYQYGTWHSGGSQITAHRIFFPYSNPSGTWGEMTSDVLWKQAIEHAGVLFDIGGVEINDLYYAKYYATLCFYWLTGTEYHGWESHHTYYDDFNMKSFLMDFYSDPWADCRDTSSDLQAVSRALGIDCYSRTIDPYSYDYFYTKSIDPIGSEGWGTTGWNFHQIAWSNVWDPCIRVNQPYPIVPTDMALNSYQGYLFQSGYWNVGDSFIISIVE